MQAQPPPTALSLAMCSDPENGQEAFQRPALPAGGNCPHPDPCHRRRASAGHGAGAEEAQDSEHGGSSRRRELLLSKVARGSRGLHSGMGGRHEQRLGELDTVEPEPWAA